MDFGQVIASINHWAVLVAALRHCYPLSRLPASRQGSVKVEPCYFPQLSPSIEAKTGGETT